MKTLKHIGALVAAIAIFPMLTACGHVQSAMPKPVVLSVDPALTAKDACPAWPRKADVIILGTDEEGAEYDLKGYEAYRCERATRLKIGDQVAKLKKDQAKR